MKSNLAIALLSSAVLAQQDQFVQEYAQDQHRPIEGHYRHQARLGDHHEVLHHERESLPPGYAYPSDSHYSETEHERHSEDQYQYHPIFENQIYGLPAQATMGYPYQQQAPLTSTQRAPSKMQYQTSSQQPLQSTQRPAQQTPTYRQQQPSQQQFYQPKPQQPITYPAQPRALQQYKTYSPQHTYAGGADVYPSSSEYKGYGAPMSPYTQPPMSSYPPGMSYAPQQAQYGSTPPGQMTMPYTEVYPDGKMLTGYDVYGRPQYGFPSQPLPTSVQAPMQASIQGPIQGPMVQSSQQPIYSRTSQPPVQPLTAQQQSQKPLDQPLPPQQQPLMSALQESTRQVDQSNPYMEQAEAKLWYKQQEQQMKQTTTGQKQQTKLEQDRQKQQAKQAKKEAKLDLKQLKLSQKMQTTRYNYDQYNSRVPVYKDSNTRPQAPGYVKLDFPPLTSTGGLKKPGQTLHPYSNMLDLVHPSTESHGQVRSDEPEYITEQGRKFALLDWDLEEPDTIPISPTDDDDADEVDEKAEEQDEEDEDQEEEEVEEEEDEPEPVEKSHKSKKKKDKKKDKKHKKGKHGDYGSHKGYNSAEEIEQIKPHMDVGEREYQNEHHQMHGYEHEFDADRHHYDDQFWSHHDTPYHIPYYDHETDHRVHPFEPKDHTHDDGHYEEILEREHDLAEDSDFSQMDHEHRMQQLQHESAIRYRQRQLYGEHYGQHDKDHTSQPSSWDHEKLHLEGGHNKHYTKDLDVPEHYTIDWDHVVHDSHNQHYDHQPQEIYQQFRLDWPHHELEDERVVGFHKDFVDGLELDHKIRTYDERINEHEAGLRVRYEDPRLHVPVQDHPLYEEQQPTDYDFATYEQLGGSLIEDLHRTQYHQQPQMEYHGVPAFITEEKVIPSTSQHEKVTKTKEEIKPSPHISEPAHPAEHQQVVKKDTPISKKPKIETPKAAPVPVHHEPESHQQKPVTIASPQLTVTTEPKKAIDVDGKVKNGDLGHMYHDYYHTNDRYQDVQDYHTGYDRFHDPTAPAHYNNETPMYVRPYLEDPIFLQPDDDEVAQLHPQVSHNEEDKKIYHHDLQGDADLENVNAVYHLLQV